LLIWTVSQSVEPLDEITLASHTGLIQSMIPSSSSSIDDFNSATKLKLGPTPVTDKLREQVSRSVGESDDAMNGFGATSHETNGHAHVEKNGDIEMSDPAAVAARQIDPDFKAVKLEPEGDLQGLISPEESETLPPVPAVFRIFDLKREIETVRDKRKLIRLGPDNSGEPSSVVLPSVLSLTVHDNGEG
jgi:transcription initiation factor TFIID subunit 5